MNFCLKFKEKFLSFCNMSFEDAFIGLALEGDFLKSWILSPPAQNDDGGSGDFRKLLFCYFRDRRWWCER